MLRAAVVSLTLLASTPAPNPSAPMSPPLHPLEKTGDGVIIRTSELIKQKPEGDSPTVRVWNIHQTALSRNNLVEMKGPTSLHVHPDADHRLFVIEGELKVFIGTQVTIAKVGDFISIPAGVRHKYDVIKPGARALLVSMDAPPYDPKKTIVLDAPAAAKAGATTGSK
jgi:mannose-6-phosphate isomerase-like protein (cupin superfamily)